MTLAFHCNSVSLLRNGTNFSRRKHITHAYIERNKQKTFVLKKKPNKQKLLNSHL